MALVTANNVAVIEGTIVRPLVGVWTADLKLDQTGDTSGFTAGTQVTIASENGYSLVGVVDPNRGGSFLDSVHVRIVGGAGGMSKLATARAYGQAFVRDVVNGLMNDSGESLSTTVDAGLLATSIAGWSVMAHTVGWNLRALLRIVAPSMSWRFLPDGTLWIGSESWSSASGTFDAIDQDPADGSYVLGVEAPFVVPGTSISGLGNVNRCIDVITARRLRTHVYVDFPSEGTRGAMSSIARMVAQATAGFDFYGQYICEVVSQSSDLTTVDVQPHNDRAKKLLNGLSSIPVYFVTGIKAQIATGSTVLIGWDGGDPRYPYALAGFCGDTSQKTTIKATAVNLGDEIGADNVLTKADETALITAIAAATYVNAAGVTTAIAFVPPTSYASNSVKATR